ncbi:MAG: hypothetical protein JWO38_7537 [Gemmataceae bacterium]|nr:hypothetical protein [Gemmataceae bacterium]
MVRRIGLLLVAVTAVAGCGKTGSSEPPGNFTVVADDDPRMNAAIEKARAEVGKFTAALRSPKARQSGFSVKVPIADGGQTEHMWLSDVRFDGQKFRGKINNDPQMVSKVKLGDEITAEAAKISDWMYLENRKLVGGYTIRVLREALPADKRAEFDKGLPFVID